MAIFDTDVLIHFFRHHAGARRVFEEEPERFISAITYMEIMQGARSKREMQVMSNYLTEYEFIQLPLTENIGHRATLYIEEFSLGSGLHLTDALIAATAMEKRMGLVTGNVKHFKMIPGLYVKAFKP